MTDPTATIRVSVDPTNPGQFFACCGLLELADRLWPCDNAVGWFEPNDYAFCISVDRATGDEASRLIRAITTCGLRNTMTAEQLTRLEELGNIPDAERKRIAGMDNEKKELDRLWRESPILLDEPFDLRLDWFQDDQAGGSRYKTWAGQQSVIVIARAMKQPVEREWSALPPTEWLGRSADDEGLPFNFDADLAAAGSAIDMGFSLDPLKMSVRSRPFLELAAFIGLQRFRPAYRGGNRYTYSLWGDPLPPELAAPAAAGVLERPDWPGYEFRLLYRTKYLKSFLSAQRTRGE